MRFHHRSVRYIGKIGKPKIGEAGGTSGLRLSIFLKTATEVYLRSREVIASLIEWGESYLGCPDLKKGLLMV
jgi:hypothetical protein